MIAVPILGVLLLSIAVGTALYCFLNPKGRYFDSNGVRIHYFERGKGTPVVLVHGLGITGGLNWVVPGIVRKLAHDYHVIAIDCRGHGRSGKPHEPNQYGTQMVEDIVRLMDHLAIDRAHVVGYSMGGFITLKMLTMHPERLLSASPCGAGWSANPTKDLTFLVECADSVDNGTGFLPLMDRLQPAGVRYRFFEPWLPDFLMRLINDLKAMSALLRGMRDLEVSEAELRNNQVPCLAIVGEIDPLKEFADQMAAVTAHIEYVVVPKADHLTTLWRSPSAERLAAFLATHSPQA